MLDFGFYLNDEDVALIAQSANDAETEQLEEGSQAQLPTLRVVMGSGKYGISGEGGEILADGSIRFGRVVFTTKRAELHPLRRQYLHDHWARRGRKME